MAIAIKPPRWQRPRAQEWREWVEGYLFASPFIIGFLVFVAYPMAYSLWLAFQRWDGILGVRDYLVVEDAFYEGRPADRTEWGESRGYSFRDPLVIDIDSLSEPAATAAESAA